MLNTPRGSPASSAAKGGESAEYADRFIPARRGINLQEDFDLLPDSPPRAREPASSAGGGHAGDAPGRDESLDAYTMLLRSELLGDEPASHSGSHRRGECSSAAGVSNPQANGNLFRYRVPPSPRDASLPFSLSPMSAASQRAAPVSRRTPRKIPSAPYKVLDAPALQDDFYLNLVDWSSSNLLAVGLGAPGC
jgi:cell division cycle 20-like protein 1 (cofactor of APC complex)